MNRDELARQVAKAHQDLAPTLQLEQSNKTRYYGRLFEAVAAGTILSYQLDQKEHHHANQGTATKNSRY